VVYNGEPEKSVLDNIRAVRDTIKLMTVDELRAVVHALPTGALDARVPKKEDVALIMYTSGSTGNPKGVVLKHSNLVASVGAVFTLAEHHLIPSDTFLAYLPLAHVLEFIFELVFFYAGLPIGYGRVRTLSDAFVRSCHGKFVALWSMSTWQNQRIRDGETI